MSFSEPGQQQPAAPQSGLSVSLSSNNPFRNRAASPSSIDAALSSPASPFDPPPRPLSRNPFFDNSLPSSAPSTANMPSHSNSKSLSAEEIFDSLTLDDKKASGKLPAMPRPPQRRPAEPPVPQRENKPPGKLPKASHRPTRSQEEALRARKPQPGPPRPGPSGSPQRKPPPRPRRNSESSVMDFSAAPITAEEMKMIEAKRLRERQKREREGRSTGREARDTREGREGRDGKERSKSTKRPSRRLDIIDQLDATSIYGTGLFHHDGPFDALNPHRNRQNSRRAPMQAFPKDSLNNSLGGAGPLNRNPDHAVFMGNGTDEAFRDYAGNNPKNGYNYPPSADPAIFDPVSRGAAIHGDESVGLGTSTFLEGTPAARTAIARREAEQAQELVEGGLQRKKSLAQRIRHINKGPRDFSSSGRMTNPEAAYTRLSHGPASAGAASGGSEAANPFFSEFSKGEETISVKPRDGSGSPTSPPRIPRRLSGGALERRSTADGLATSEESNAKPSGLLGRMKSLKGGRKPRVSDQGPVQSSVAM